MLCRVLPQGDETSSIESLEAMHRWVIPPNTKVPLTWPGCMLESHLQA